KAILPSLVTALEQHGHLALDPTVRRHLLSASAATIDRLLTPVRSTASKRRWRPMAAGRTLDVEPMRALFRQNCIISSITAELDQKSCWEILTDARFTQRCCAAADRQSSRRHIFWTRLLSDRRTVLPDGQTASLLDYVGREHESLVLKPNRSFGGQGVVIGHGLARAE